MTAPAAPRRLRRFAARWGRPCSSTRLRLQGFKSFVDPTELVIAEGLTGVVGPNGCGKSNLLEALRWVMGENRAKAMRGEGMEDVIFAGADSRPARGGRAWTSPSTIPTGSPPPAFNTVDQIEITRRITRDIGSAYSRSTGKTVRARDVQMLFADASTGAHSPALVRQGQIAELINAKPKARRRVLEEAAGISGLYQRRHEAELKLNAAEQNLARVDDQLEGSRADRALERRRRRRRRYREIAEALRRAEAVLLWLRWHRRRSARTEAGRPRPRPRPQVPARGVRRGAPRPAASRPRPCPPCARKPGRRRGPPAQLDRARPAGRGNCPRPAIAEIERLERTGASSPRSRARGGPRPRRRRRARGARRRSGPARGRGDPEASRLAEAAEAAATAAEALSAAEARPTA